LESEKVAQHQKITFSGIKRFKEAETLTASMRAHMQSTYLKIELNLGFKKNNVIINLLVRDQKGTWKKKP
jgi:hypothetical protein